MKTFRIHPGFTQDNISNLFGRILGSTGSSGPLLWVYFVLISCLNMVTSQVIMPGANPKVFLPKKCDGFALNGLRRGVIYSHEDGDRYMPNTKCMVLFSTNPDQVVHFRFEKFILQNKVKGQCKDYVQFFTGETLDIPLTEPLCGETVPTPLASNSSQIAMVFTTNAHYENKGFRLRFERNRQNKACLVSGQSGCVQSPGTGHPALTNSTLSLSELSRTFLIFPVLVVLILIWVRYS